MKKFAIFFLLLPLILIAGCTDQLIRSQIEKGIRNAMPTYIGPAKSYTVKADGDTGDMLNGLIAHLRIEGTEVEISPNLRLQNLTVDMDNLRYTSKRKLKSVDKAVFTADVTQDAINRYIREERPNEYHLRTRLKEDQVAVLLDPELLGLKVPVCIEGKPRITDSTKVSFVADSGAIARLPVSAWVINQALNTVNPILDLSTLAFPVKIRRITIDRDTVHVTGQAVITPQTTTSKKP